MKKVILSLAFVAISFSVSAQSSGFNLGADIGMPTGDVKDFFSLTMTVNATYMFGESDQFNYGVAASYSYWKGKDAAGNGSFLPLAGALRFNASESFVLGTDIGYAIGISPSGNNGGFYYKPMLGYNISENMMVQASYSGVSSDGTNFSNFGIGIMFGI
jgi:hypothetical protein